MSFKFFVLSYVSKKCCMCVIFFVWCFFCLLVRSQHQSSTKCVKLRYKLFDLFLIFYFYFHFHVSGACTHIEDKHTNFIPKILLGSNAQLIEHLLS